MIERHLAKLRARHEISELEESAIRGLVSETKVVPRRTTVVRQGVELNTSMVLLSGFLCRFKDLPRGERQISELHVPGDFADLHSFTLKHLDHSVQSISDCIIGIVPHSRIRDLIEAHPRLGHIYWFSTNLDAAVHREWELSLGRRDALARTAALFCELQTRLDLVGLVDAQGFELPMTQEQVAECLGLTPVHVNRTLRQLREGEIASFRSGRVYIKDQAALRATASFDEDYLYLRK